MLFWLTKAIYFNMLCFVSERASISSVHVNWRYIFMCMYSFFYDTFTRASMNNLDSVRNCIFMQAGVAPINDADSTIAHTTWKKRKQIKEKAGIGERSQTLSVGIQKKK